MTVNDPLCGCVVGLSQHPTLCVVRRPVCTPQVRGDWQDKKPQKCRDGHGSQHTKPPPKALRLLRGLRPKSVFPVAVANVT